jgi:hypothetical protein
VAVVVVTTESEDAAVAGGVLVGETEILVVLPAGCACGAFRDGGLQPIETWCTRSLDRNAAMCRSRVCCCCFLWYYPNQQMTDPCLDTVSEHAAD